MTKNPLTGTGAVRADTPAAPPAVSVTLCGKHAHGRRLLIDAADWQAISETYGEHWGLTATGYVYSSRADALRAAEGVATGNLVFLARLVGRLIAGHKVDAVVFKNGDRLDMRRKNLSFSRLDQLSRWERPTVTVEPYVETGAAA